MISSAIEQPVPEPHTETYRRIASETDENLKEHVLAAWFPRAVDPQGGFFQNFDETWAQMPDDRRSVVYQSRLTWVAAKTAMRYPEKSAEYRAHSRHGMEFLLATLWDDENGGFYWASDKNGVPMFDGEKHAYGNSFALYAVCANYEATHDARALDLGKRIFEWLEAQAHDSVNGGYYEALSRTGETILAAHDSREIDMIDTHYGLKSMNSHIHLLEAFTALYEIWPDAVLRARLEEVFGIVRDKVAVGTVGCLNLFFTPDWRPVPHLDSFGHDVETAYLLAEAAAILGSPDDEETWQVARRLVDHALSVGWDEENGGFYNEGPAFGKPHDTDKIWWVQAEGLNALLLLHERFGGDDPRYWAAFCRQWEFIQSHQIDRRRGGWYPDVAKDGTYRPGGIKSDAWTEAYHQGRALMNVSSALTRLAAPQVWGKEVKKGRHGDLPLQEE